MKYIRHKVSGHESTVSDADWEMMKATKIPGDPHKTWAQGYKVLQDAPEPKGEAAAFIPPEVKLSNSIEVPKSIEPTSPEKKTETTPGSKKQNSKNKSQ